MHCRLFSVGIYSILKIHSYIHRPGIIAAPSQPQNTRHLLQAVRCAPASPPHHGHPRRTIAHRRRRRMQRCRPRRLHRCRRRRRGPLHRRTYQTPGASSSLDRCSTSTNGLRRPTFIIAVAAAATNDGQHTAGPQVHVPGAIAPAKDERGISGSDSNLRAHGTIRMHLAGSLRSPAARIGPICRYVQMYNHTPSSIYLCMYLCM